MNKCARCNICCCVFYVDQLSKSCSVELSTKKLEASEEPLISFKKEKRKKKRREELIDHIRSSQESQFFGSLPNLIVCSIFLNIDWLGGIKRVSKELVSKSWRLWWKIVVWIVRSFSFFFYWPIFKSGLYLSLHLRMKM